MQKDELSSKSLRPLIRSASIIIYDKQQILMFQRKANISFANSTVFPGGACDLEDQQELNKQIKKSSFWIFAKITAIRQLFQQTGILLLPPQYVSENNQLMQQIIKKQITSAQITHKKIVEIWKNNLNLICPIFRLLTVQYLKGMKRFDTIFYTPKPEVLKLNFLEFVTSKNSSKEYLHNLSKLHISGEGVSYLWDSSVNILTKAIQNKLVLAPPQIIILNCLKNTTHNVICNILVQKAIEPVLMIMRSQFTKFLLFRDKQYDPRLILKQQPESKSREQLNQYFQLHKKDSMRHDRMMIAQQMSMFMKSSYQQGSLLNFMNRKSQL